MAKFVFYASGSNAAHYLAAVPIMQELRERNHDVLGYFDSAHIGVVSDLGFDARPINPAIERIPLEDWRLENRIAALLELYRTFRRRAPHEASDMQAIIERDRPDVLVVDGISGGAGAVAEGWGGPWAYFSTVLLPVPSADTPPFGPGLRPRDGLIGRARDYAIGALLRRQYDKLLPEYNRLREELNVPEVRHGTGLLTRAPLTLSFTAEPFEYRHSDWPDSIRLVGPSIWEPPADLPSWIDEINAPIVTVALSSQFQADERLVGVALEALAGEDAFVVATAPDVDPVRFNLPSNARVERFLPHWRLMKRSSCVVCSATMGTTQKALAAGVPVCAVPFRRDQPEVARRVEEAGAGTRLVASRLQPSRLKSAIFRAMEQKDGAQRIANAFAQTNCGKSGADALEGIWNA